MEGLTDNGQVDVKIFNMKSRLAICSTVSKRRTLETSCQISTPVWVVHADFILFGVCPVGQLLHERLPTRHSFRVSASGSVMEDMGSKTRTTRPFTWFRQVDSSTYFLKMLFSGVLGRPVFTKGGKTQKSRAQKRVIGTRVVWICILSSGTAKMLRKS